MNHLILSLLFVGAGLVAIAYYRAVPTGETLRGRLPNRIGVDGVFLALLIGGAVWIIFAQTSGFLRAAWVSTLFVFLLVVETFLLLAMRWLASNLAALILSVVLAALPVLLLTQAPSFALINAILIAATFGATTLLIRLRYFGTPTIVLLVGLLMAIDILNILYLVPSLPLSPLTAPLPYIIFPVVAVGGSAVGFGDFMFLALGTVVLLRDRTLERAVLFIGVTSGALGVTSFLAARYDLLFPFLVVMVPVFLTILGRRKKTDQATK